MAKRVTDLKTGLLGLVKEHYGILIFFILFSVASVIFFIQSGNALAAVASFIWVFFMLGFLVEATKGIGLLGVLRWSAATGIILWFTDDMWIGMVKEPILLSDFFWLVVLHMAISLFACATICMIICSVIWLAFWAWKKLGPSRAAGT